MRLPFLLLVFALSFVAATIIPPITTGENWEQFHEDGGCFRDVYLYDDESVLLDERVPLRTKVVVVGDFSLPTYKDNALLLEYQIELFTLANFISELSAQAFPVSYYENYADETTVTAGYPTASPLKYDSSLELYYTSYYPVTAQDTGTPTTNTSSTTPGGDSFLNSATCCSENIIKKIEADYNTVKTDMQNELRILLYKDFNYWYGINKMLQAIPHCSPQQERCYIVFGRVQPASFDNRFTNATWLMRKLGYQIVTLDGAVYHTAGVATGLASEPTSRFAHMLPSNAYSPKVELAGAKLVQAIRGGSSACMTFGAHQVLTFDGVGYDHQEIGDFVLAKDVYAGSFEVQIRNELCAADPEAPQVVCTTGLAFKSGQRILTINYDRWSDMIAVSVDGVLHKPGYLKYTEFEAYVIAREPSNGYQIAIYTGFNELVPYFNYVQATFTFFGSVAVYPAPSLMYGMAGLCGTYDNCNLDEFYTNRNEFVEDQATFTHSWFVHGGESLFEANKYRDAKTPFIMHQPFLPPTQEFWSFSPDEVTDEHRNYCSKFGDAGAFFYDTCMELQQMQVQMTDDMFQQMIAMFPHNFNLNDLAMWNAQAQVCSDMCRTGMSRMFFTNTNMNCSTICDWQMADFEGLVFQFPNTVNTNPDYRINLPVQASYFGWQSFFYPPMGGDYLLRVRSYDCCLESEDLKFIYSVNCENYRMLVTIDKNQTGYYGYGGVIPINEFSLPLVELAAAVEKADEFDNGLVHAAWNFLSVPAGTPKPDLYNDFSLWPSFVPQAKGAYVVQVVVTDGCSASADTAIVYVECYTRDYTLSTKGSDSMIFEQSEEWWNSYFANSYLTLVDDCLAPISTTTAQMYTEFPWTFAPISWTRTVTRATTISGNLGDLLQVATIYEENVTLAEKDFEVFWEIRTTPVVRAINIRTTNYVPSTKVYPTHVPQSAALSQHNYGIIRAEARIDVSEITVGDHTYITGHYDTYKWIKSVECWIYTRIMNDPVGDGTYKSKMAFWARNAYPNDAVWAFNNTFLPLNTVNVYTSWVAGGRMLSFGYDQISLNYYDWLKKDPAYARYVQLTKDNWYFHTGHCPGTYKIDVTMSDRFACADGVDSFLLDAAVIRRPMSLPIMPCFIIYFDYYLEKYPNAYLMGYDSITPAWRNMDFKWVVRDVVHDYYDIVDPDVVDITIINAKTWNFSPMGSDWMGTAGTTPSSDPIEGPADWLDFQFSRPPYNTNKNVYRKDLRTFESAPDVFEATLYVTDHAMNDETTITVWFQCRDHPHVDLDWEYLETTTPLLIPTELAAGKELFGNNSHCGAWMYGALRDPCIQGTNTAGTACLPWDSTTEFWSDAGGFAYYCYDPADVVYFRTMYGGYNGTDFWSWGTLGCSFGLRTTTTDPNRAEYLFTANHAGSYIAELRLYDQCSWSWDNMTMVVQCDSSHPRLSYTVSNSLVTAAITEGTTIRVTWGATGGYGTGYVSAQNSGGSSDTNFLWCFTDVNGIVLDAAWDCETLASDQYPYATIAASTNRLGNSYAIEGVYHLVIAVYDGCQHDEFYFQVQFVCDDTLIPTPPTYSVRNNQQIFGFNNSAYQIGLTTAGTLDNRWPAVWYLWTSQFDNGDIPAAKDWEFYYANCAWPWIGNTRAWYGGTDIFTVDQLATTSGDQFTLRLTHTISAGPPAVIAGCDYDQVNQVTLRLCYTDGCTAYTHYACSAPVTISLMCRWDFDFSPVVALEEDYWNWARRTGHDHDVLVDTFGQSLTVTWHDGEFPTVCEWVPYDSVHFTWNVGARGWPAAWNPNGAPTASGATSPAAYNVNWNFYEWNTNDCNWHDCVYLHLWEFNNSGTTYATATPARSVYQTGQTTPTSIITPAVVSSSTAPIPKTYINTPTIKGDWCQNLRTTYGWMWKNDTECGGGYYMTYVLNTVYNTTIYHKYYTWLVSGWDYTTEYDPEDGEWYVGGYPNNHDDRENAWLGTCWRPDVDGVYNLRLHAWDGCWHRTPFHDVVVTAQCGDAPHVNVAPITNAFVGDRTVFTATVIDANDFMHAVQWSLYTCNPNQPRIDLTDYVTNAHGLNASFIPTLTGCHFYSLSVDDGCNPVVPVTGTFDVGCRSGGAPLPQPPVNDDGDKQIYAVYDFSGLGTLPLYSHVINEEEDITFHWKIVGFEPRYVTWESEYGDNSKRAAEVPAARGASSVVAPIFALLSLLSLFLLF